MHNSTAETDNISSNVNYRKHNTISEFIVYSALTAYGKSALDNFFCFKPLWSQIFKQMIVSFGCISQTVYRNRFPRYITFCKILLTFFAYVFITQTIIKKSRWKFVHCQNTFLLFMGRVRKISVIFGNYYTCIVGKQLQRINKVKIFCTHYELHQITARTASEAVKKLFLLTYMEWRCFFMMKRTKSAVITSRFF